MKKPREVNVLGVVYKIEYLKRPSDVDHQGRTSLWGQTDHWRRSIRIYDNGKDDRDLWQTILHEVFHAIDEQIRLKCFEGEQGHHELGQIASVLSDTLFRNGWFK